MKINEVEMLVGITKKNIRFYEEQGLLTPRRNTENGYRDYSDDDVEVLRRIKFLRKLGVPIEEIRAVQNGTHTLEDGMRRHLISLERDQENMKQSIALCQELVNMGVPIKELKTEEILDKMEDMEKKGTSFQNKHKGDVRKHYVAPIIISIIMIVYTVAMAALLVWAYKVEPNEAPPMWFLVLMILMFAAMAVGMLLALKQRLGEINKGEIEDAKKY